MLAAARTTLLLAAVLGGLVVVDVALVAASSESAAELPEIPKVDPLAADTIKVERGETEVVLRKGDEGAWKIVQPLEFPADDAAIKGILQLLRKGVRMDVQVQKGDLKGYGLENPSAIRVTVSTGDTVSADFYVGNNAAGGSTFVRFPDDDVVYRARVGGRARFEKEPKDWRDPTVWGYPPERLTKITLRRAEGVLTFVRERSEADPDKPALGPWTLAGEPLYPLDQQTVDQLAGYLASLRAGEILAGDAPAGMDPPAARVAIEVDGQPAPPIAFGRTASGTFVKRDGTDAVFRVADGLLDLVTRPKAVFRDLQLFRFNMMDAMKLTLVEPGLTSVLERDPTDSSWRITQPKNVDVTLREANGAARELSGLRAVGIGLLGPSEAGFPSETRIVVDLADGRRFTLEVGDKVPDLPEGQDAVFVRTLDQPDRVGLIATRLLVAIKKAWSR